MKSDMARLLLNKVRRFCRAESMFSPGDVVVVMVSGGPDSTALLDLLARLRSAWALELFALHCDHGLRALAERDQSVAVAQAKSLDIQVTVRRLDVGAAAKVRGLGIEEAGRFLRYQAARELAAAVGAGKIATGHTADDVGEWQLMSIITGTSAAGLSGMSPLGSDGLVRPILCATKQEVLTYCGENGLEYVLDETNAQERFLRSRVRARVVPVAREINPSFALTALGTGAILRLDNEFIDLHFREWCQNNVRYSGKRVVVDLPAARNAHAAILVRAVFAGAARLRPTLRLGSAAVLATVRLALEGAVGARVDLGAGLAAYIEPRRLVIEGTDERGIEDITLEPGQERDLGAAGRVRVSYVTSRPSRLEDGGDSAVADADRLEGPLRVRSRGFGDTFMPLGMSGTKKLQDFFVDAKVPRRVRGLIPIFEDGKKIVWVAGYRLDERVKVTTRTRRFALLQLYRENE